MFCSKFTINLTGSPLSQSTIELLDMGLTYIPTIDLIKTQDAVDACKYIVRRVALHDYFYFHGESEDYDPSDFNKKFKSKSKWHPKPYQLSSTTLETIKLIQDSLINLRGGKVTVINNIEHIRQKVTRNITKSQLNTIRSLRSNQEIIIKSADKGGSVVVMSTPLYVQEVMRQLNNKNYYLPLETPLYLETADLMLQVLKKLRNTGSISSRQLDYLKPDPSTMGSRYFYLLPKVHKSPGCWPHPRMPPGRPIVSDCESESSRICEYIDHYLQPLSIRHPAYLKDTYDFIDKVRDQQIEPHWYLITADVEALYTNMRLDLIIESIKEVFNEYPDPSRPDKGLIELLSLTLNRNDFEFDGNFYLQVCGIAMGRKYAPATANIYLRKFDKAAMSDFHIKPIAYGRFLDDIFAIWPGSLEELKQFELFLNNLIPGIKVKFTARQQIIEFLDTHIYKHTDSSGICRLKSKVYFKNTDTHQLLHRKSYHPKHTFSGIVKSQFIRFKRISSTYQDYQQASATLIAVLRIRGYKLSKLIKQKRDVWRNYNTNKQTNTQLQNEYLLPTKRVLPVVTFYDHFHARLNRQWKSHIKNNPVFENIHTIAAFKRHKNFRDLLVRGRFGNNKNNNSDEGDAEALLSALVDIVQRDNSTEDDTPFFPNDSG